MIDPKQHALIIRILHTPGKPAEPKKVAEKITRVAFLYLDGDKDDYAQCSSCFLYVNSKKRCAILGNDFEVAPEDTCAMYIPGDPVENQPIVKRVSPEEAGYVARKVRCENCFYGGDECKLFVMLNKKMPEVFDLDPKIVSKGCCNAQTPRE
jgi:hypothetical protein